MVCLALICSTMHTIEFFLKTTVANKSIIA